MALGMNVHGKICHWLQLIPSINICRSIHWLKNYSVMVFFEVFQNKKKINVEIFSIQLHVPHFGLPAMTMPLICAMNGPPVVRFSRSPIGVPASRIVWTTMNIVFWFGKILGSGMIYPVAINWVSFVKRIVISKKRPRNWKSLKKSARRLMMWANLRILLYLLIRSQLLNI